MKTETLFAISPIDGRYFYETKTLQNYFSEFTLIKSRVQVEVNWLITMIKLLGPKQALNHQIELFLNQIYYNFTLNDAKRIKAIEQKINHDLKAVEYFLREKISKNKKLSKYTAFIHFACTSDDINNLAYALMLKHFRHNELVPKLNALTNTLSKMAKKYMKRSMLSKTHGQAATPTTMGKEIANFVIRLKQQISKLMQIKILGKINGASGNFNAHTFTYPEIDWLKVSQKFVINLGLRHNPCTTQIEPHDYLAEISHTLSLINTILIGFSRDMWGYISAGYFLQKVSPRSVGSSTMPHKVNPIDFENAEGNLGLANSLLNHFSSKLPISRFQRDLSDSTVLRNLGTAGAHSLLAYNSLQKGLTKIEINPEALTRDLEHHWEVLAEAVQTILRSANVTNAYEIIKTLTHGQAFDKNNYLTLVKQLNLTAPLEKRLLALTPAKYVGLAEKIVKKYCS